MASLSRLACSIGPPYWPRILFLMLVILASMRSYIARSCFSVKSGAMSAMTTSCRHRRADFHRDFPKLNLSCFLSSVSLVSEVSEASAVTGHRRHLGQFGQFGQGGYSVGLKAISVPLSVVSACFPAALCLQGIAVSAVLCGP